MSSSPDRVVTRLRPGALRMALDVRPRPPAWPDSRVRRLCLTSAAPAADQPTTLSYPLVLPSPTLREQHPPACTSDTTSTSLASRVPDWSKRFVKSLADIFVISLRIKTGSQRGHKQLVLILQKAISLRASNDLFTSISIARFRSSFQLDTL
jgi:hypothetical protein